MRQYETVNFRFLNISLTLYNCVRLSVRFIDSILYLLYREKHQSLVLSIVHFMNSTVECPVENVQYFKNIKN